ncbi:amino acid ABC transporter permease [Gymnodinialimonas sp. 2305UL16-5]|uniref:amino acid ABC transporter permease n=1 Tax=Gymnodinialimonas mytili TaxID=3126503 RepID=UPI00309D852F
MSDMNANRAFVRSDMLPEQAPPALETGVVKWLRENLFSSWINTILTLVSFALIYWVAQIIVPWAVFGIWDAGSLTECRAIRDELYGVSDGHGGGVACWAVIAERWPQIIFGFYPSDLYWRPILAFALFWVAITPVLFEGAPRQLLVVTVAFPFVAVALLWGNVGGPIAVALGFALGWAIYKFATPAIGQLAGTIATIVVPILYWILLSGYIGDGLSAILPGLEPVGSSRFGGFLLALVIGISCIVLSLPIGIMLALARQSDLFIINKSAVVFIEVFRGVPMIVWLFSASLLLGYFLPEGMDPDDLVRVIILITLFSAAYIAEVIRGGLAALPRGQYEGADSLGLDYWQSMRLIILPQALKISIPGIVSTFIGLFKDTTLVVFIGLLDPLKGLSDAIRATTEWNGIYWELFIFSGAIFFIFCFGMSQYSQYLERKLATDRR